jgi:cell division protein FtsI/penicillin-binding protein 2
MEGTAPGAGSYGGGADPLGGDASAAGWSAGDWGAPAADSAGTGTPAADAWSAAPADSAGAGAPGWDAWAPAPGAGVPAGFWAPVAGAPVPDPTASGEPAPGDVPAGGGSALDDGALHRGARGRRAGAAPADVPGREPWLVPPAGSTVAAWATRASSAVRAVRTAVAESHRARVRLVAASTGVVLLSVAIAFGLFTPHTSPEPTAQAFLLDWGTGQYRAAATLTTGTPHDVAASLEAAYHQLGATDLTLSMGYIRQQAGTATAGFSASVDLGRGGPPWNYQGTFTLRETGSVWKVVWTPGVIVPGLLPGLRLAVLTSMPQRADLLDAAGAPLEPLSPVYVAGVHPGDLSHPLLTADVLASATGLEADQILGQIRAASTGGFLELLRLSPAEYRQLRRGLAKVPGLIIRREQMRLFDSIAPAVSGQVGTETAVQLRNEGVPYRPGTTIGTSGLEKAFQRQLAGTSTTEVVTENAAGKLVSVLKRWSGQPGRTVRTTIDASVQVAADDALASLPASAAIVAVQPSTGHILAVADHSATGMPAVNPLDGQYQPGQAFTIVSTEALLTTGFATSTPIPCNSANEVGGENFTNDPPIPSLGPQPTFLTDFAHACDTAFAGLSLRLNAKDLAKAAAGFGLGATWRLPLHAFAGSVGAAGSQAQLAADSIGAGSVRVSPLDMALVAALVESGTLRSPSLVTSPPDPGLNPRASFGTQVVQALRTLMRATVVSGAGRAANVRGAPVYGQVGSAPLATVKGLHATWFVGFQGNVAFAVLEFAKSARTSAAPLAGRFLRDLARS